MCFFSIPLYKSHNHIGCTAVNSFQLISILLHMTIQTQPENNFKKRSHLPVNTQVRMILFVF